MRFQQRIKKLERMRGTPINVDAITDQQISATLAQLTHKGKDSVIADLLPLEHVRQKIISALLKLIGERGQTIFNRRDDQPPITKNDIFTLDEFP